ncbi:hypothetical protein ES319_D13G192100v1 [Gossypium barbadense]|uniref:Uncharacterized protein n=1 Tax=Gossypium barbadense TaxID=3634 RepID=A0A5J5NSZ5_GOSBA|nr:hypothetical protein ES319_D13G192100v1 [Gossypium barbadense]
MEVEHMKGGLRSRSYNLGFKRIKVREENGEEEEPLSPMARMFHQPESNIYIVVIVGYKRLIDPDVYKTNLTKTFLKHPRFSCLQVADEKSGGEVKWVKTNVDINQHVKVPMVDPYMASPDKFVEDYVANLSKTRMSMSLPMWDFHILNLKTSDAESTVVVRVHHSLADGTSLMALLLSCSDALPSFPAMKKKPISRGAGWFPIWFWKSWSVLLLMWNTLVDMDVDVAFTPRRIVRRTFSLDDVKLVKTATHTTVNDVVLAMTQAGLSRYLNRKYGQAKSDGEARESCENNLPNNIRLTATLFINLRTSPGIYALEEMVKKNSKAEWGNKIGYVLYPFKIELKDNPLDYIRDAKAKIDRKKATLEAKFRLFLAKVFVRFYPTKLAKFPSTTMWFSNVAGPQEPISILGNQVAFIAPSIYGQPVALTIHVVSYVNKMSMVLSVDEDIIADPYQLCDDLEEALKLIKNCVIGQGVIDN